MLKMPHCEAPVGGDYSKRAQRIHAGRLQPHHAGPTIVRYCVSIYLLMQRDCVSGGGGRQIPGDSAAWRSQSEGWDG